MAYAREQLPETISVASPLDEGLPEAYAGGLKQLLQEQLSSRGAYETLFGVLFTVFIYGIALLVVFGILKFALIFLFIIHPIAGLLGLLAALYGVFKCLRFLFKRKRSFRQIINSIKSETLDTDLDAIGDAVLAQLALSRGWVKSGFNAPWLQSVDNSYPFELKNNQGMLDQKLDILFAYEHPELQIEMALVGKKGKSMPCLMVRMPCHKSMQSTTAAVMDMGWMRHGGGSLRWPLKKVRLVSAEFEQAFEVFSSDQVEGRAMMTPDIMQKLLDHTKDQMVLTSMVYPLDEPERALEIKKGFLARVAGLFNTPMLIFKDEHLIVMYRHPLHPFYPVNVPNEMDNGHPIRRIWRRLVMIEGLKQFYFPNR